MSALQNTIQQDLKKRIIKLQEWLVKNNESQYLITKLAEYEKLNSLITDENIKRDINNNYNKLKDEEQ